MLASTKKSMGSTISTTKSMALKSKESFFSFIFRKVTQAFNRVLLFSRKFLWISSTALIVMILPFAFAYHLQARQQIQKLQGMSGSNNMF